MSATRDTTSINCAGVYAELGGVAHVPMGSGRAPLGRLVVLGKGAEVRLQGWQGGRWSPARALFSEVSSLTLPLPTVLSSSSGRAQRSQ
jgi:hypothetical protein